MAVAAPLVVPDSDREVLSAWLTSPSVPAELVIRARIVLRAADGSSNTETARRLGLSRQTVVTWRSRYRAYGVAGLRDRPRPGRPAVVDEVAVMVRTAQGPPDGSGVRHWSSRLLSAELGVSHGAVAKVWHKWRVQPWSTRTLTFPTSPELDATVRDVTGLYLAREEKAVVVRLGGASGPAHRASSLVSALEIATATQSTDTGGELLGFLKGVAATHARERLHLVVDGYDERRHPVVRAWLAGQRRIALHTVPDGCSWPDLVKILLGISAGPAPNSAAPAPYTGVGAALDRYTEACGGRRRPFTWVARPRTPE
ncbi:helix-turn-helix domain-containing protein [Streptomyces geranii]|uniref:helix-turn-helix domain-containing protein n=1 Tax=Streptomyces geranii TaxID=2058923 RepID=UPI000D02411C|nr:helix-turn-helix domain-containing protein [Streptomyces geranii]